MSQYSTNMKYKMFSNTVTRYKCSFQQTQFSMHTHFIEFNRGADMRQNKELSYEKQACLRYTPFKMKTFCVNIFLMFCYFSPIILLCYYIQVMQYILDILLYDMEVLNMHQEVAKLFYTVLLGCPLQAYHCLCLPHH